jgi:hypothetical protein
LVIFGRILSQLIYFRNKLYLLPLLIISYTDKVKSGTAPDIIQLFLTETLPLQLFRTVMKLAIKIESILYLKGKPLSLTKIAQCADCEVDEVQEAIIELMSDYAYRDSELEVREMSQGYSLQLRPIFDSLIDDSIPAEF